MPLAPHHVEPFATRLPRGLARDPEALLARLAEEGRPPLRWAIVAVEGDELVIEGSRLCLR